MQMTEVNSSNIARIGYDPGARELRIEFHKGGTYAYNDVPTEVWEELQVADSKGVFFHRNIKDRYGFVKM
jgi:hypothetical protein